MSEIRYALVCRDEQGKKIGSVGTRLDLLGKHQKVTPQFHRFCLSVFALNLAAVTVDIVSWFYGVDLERAKVILVVRRSEELVGSLVYSIPEQEEEVSQ
jgi:hypothetical protein